jgi:hypothetical protein
MAIIARKEVEPWLFQLFPRMTEVDWQALALMISDLCPTVKVYLKYWGLNPRTFTVHSGVARAEAYHWLVRLRLLSECFLSHL